MDSAVAEHCTELNRCNQRGGRMLSVFDLLEAKTLDLNLAAWLMARISRGASFMTGAVPGGAGKTTVMCALLNLCPIDVSLAAATPEAIRATGESEDTKRRCYICHEISSAPYFSYLWNDDLRDYCHLLGRGHMLATNLHADDLEEAQSQVCRDNNVPIELYNGFNLMIILRIKGNGYVNTKRWIEKVYATDGGSSHKLVFRAGQITPVSDGSVDPQYVQACRDFLEMTFKAGVRTIEDPRRRVIAFLRNHPSTA